MTLPSHVSLFEMSQNVVGSSAAKMRCSKRTLVHLSHVLEDIVLTNRLHAMMFTGFQESSHWMKEVDRYAELTEIAQQVCVFAGKPLPSDSALHALQIELEGDDPLRQEWFVIILSDTFNVLLTGQDNATITTPYTDSWRTFDTILSFDENVIDTVLDQLEVVLTHYRPELLYELRETRQRVHPLTTKSEYFASIITEFVTFEEQLNQRVRYESGLNTQMVNAMEAFTLTLSSDGTINTANPALRALLADQYEEVTGLNFWACCLPELSPSQGQKVIDSVLASGQGRRMSSTMMTAQGKRHIDWHIAVIYLKGSQDNIFVMGHDVTDRVQLEHVRIEEAQVRALLEHERELNELRSKFITTVSHEFRTPLTSILNSAEMLDRHHEQLGAEGRKRRIERIKDQVMVLTSMVEEITTSMSATDGSLEYTPIQCNINDITRDILRNIYGYNDTKTRIQFRSHLTDPQIIADPRLYRFILTNLVSNALKYSPMDRPVTVELAYASDKLKLTVMDQGAGILPEDRKYIFDSFYRGNNIGTINGTGIGLRIVQDCVDIYGGAINFESDASGTTFIVKLPVPNSL